MHARLSFVLMFAALAAGTESRAQVPAAEAQCAAKPTRDCVSALAVVRQMGMDGIETLIHVAEAQLDAGNLKEAARTVTRAEAAADTLKDDGQRRNAQAALAIFATVLKAMEQASAGQVAEASRTLATIAEQAQESEYISLLFASLAEGHARAGRAPAAAQVMSLAVLLAGAVKDDNIRLLTLADVAVRRAAVFSEAGDFAAATDATTGLAGNKRSEALYRIAEANAVTLAKSGQAAEALKTLAFIDNGAMRVQALCTVADIYIEAGRATDIAEALSRARTTASALREAAARDEAFARIARAEARAGQLADAMTTASNLKSDVWRIVAFDAIAAAAPN